MSVVLINVFVVPAELESAFLKSWQHTADVFSRADGFIDARLHRNTGFGNQSFRFVNFARWESAEAWNNAHEAYTPGEYDLVGVEGHPAIYEPVSEVFRASDANEKGAAISSE